MIKKHKELFIYLTFIITFIIFLVIACIKSDANSQWTAGYEISESEFSTLTSWGQAGCFHHVAINTMCRTIRDVVEVIPSGNDVIISSRKGTFSFRKDRILMSLVSGTNVTDGINTVYRAIKEGTGTYFVKNPSDNDENKQEAQHGYGNSVDSTIANFKPLTNNGSPSIQGLTNDGKHVIMGPFNITYSQRGLTNNINFYDNTSSRTSDNTIKWANSKRANWDNWNSMSSFAPNSGTDFYLAIKVEDSWIKENGTGSFTLTFYQQPISVCYAKVAICKLEDDGQAGGAYERGQFIDVSCNLSITVTGVIEKRVNLKLIKKDKLENVQPEGARFVIYYKPTAPVSSYKQNGWLTGGKGQIKDSSTNINDAQAYHVLDSNRSGITIQKLTVGQYYIFEVEPPNGFSLTCSSNYKKKAPGNISPEAKYNEWVYVGEFNVQNNTAINTNLSIENAKQGALEIRKADYDTGEEIPSGTGGIGARYKIYADLSSTTGGGLGNVTSGWLQGTASVDKKYVSNASEAQKFVAGDNIIRKLEYGKYYIYEVKTPDGYDFTEQENYKKGQPDGIPTPGNDEDWVYLGYRTVNKGEDEEIFKFDYSYGAKNKGLGALEITKKNFDNDQEISGAQFKIYADLRKEAGGTGRTASGWVNGDVTTKTPKDYKTDSAEATAYDSVVPIIGLKYGTYYIYETKAPDGCALSEQEGYKGKSENTNIPTPDDEEWVYLGSQKIDKGEKKIVYNPIKKQYELGSLRVDKNDTNNTAVTLTGAKFKIYADLSKETGSGKGTAESGWVKGDASTISEKQYVDYKEATEYDLATQVCGLKYGTYYIFETTPPTGCALSEQVNYKNAPTGTPDTPDDDVEWVYLDKIVVSKGKTVDAKQITNSQVSLGHLEIEKVDSKDPNKKLAGAEFKIYADLSVNASGKGTTESGWLQGDLEGTKQYTEYDNATTYTSTEQGLIHIKELKYGTYHLFETKAPRRYNIKKQNGYKGVRGGPVSSGTGAEDDFDEEEDWVYCGSIVIKDWAQESDPIPITIENKQVVEIEGTVWKDVDQDKTSSIGNALLDNNEETLSGLKVKLYENGVVVGETQTGQKEVEAADGLSSWHEPADDPGFYNFIRKNQGEDRDIYFSDLDNMYIEFTYNNKTIYTEYMSEDGKIKYKAEDKKYVEEGNYGYIAVKEFASTSDDAVKYSSKALPRTLSADDLDDEKLTGEGKAVTKDQDLRNYFYEDECKILGINLGLWEQIDSEFDVDETLAYVKISMNGYTYTYDFLSQRPVEENVSEQEPKPNAPNTYKQKQIGKHFTSALYPSDVSANNLGDGELKVSVTYKITIKNNQNVTVPETYYENGLYITSLTNEYNKEVYKLNNTIEDGDKQDIALWSDDGDTTSKYDTSSLEAIPMDQTKDIYVKYDVLDNVVKNMADRNFDEGWFEKEASRATGGGHHEYLRTDHVWDIGGSAKAFSGSKSTNASSEQFVHKTVTKSYDSPGLFMKFELGHSRKISGTVFEDTDEEITEDNENLGNGILDDNDVKKENRVKNVKVELLDVSKAFKEKGIEWEYKDLDVAKLYSEGKTPAIEETDTRLAVINTSETGEYSFEGVIPGYYLLRFTYGDGNQKIVGLNGEERSVFSRDYRSTIVTDDTIRNSMECSDDKEYIKDIYDTYPEPENNPEEWIREIIEWYKYIDEEKYSTATDSLELRSQTNNYIYNRDGTITRKSDGKVICKFEEENGQKKVILYDDAGNPMDSFDENDNILLMKSYTPITSISIENDQDEYTDEGDKHEEVFARFNFGIIEEAKTEILVEKGITNVEFTNQTGSTIINENPYKAKSPYLADLETVNGGSKYARLELEGNLIYGSELATTYKVKITNTKDSDVDYVEDEGEHFGDYFRFGDHSNAHQKTVQIEEAIDYLDQKYNYKSVIPENEYLLDSSGNFITDENGNKINGIKIEETYTNQEGSKTTNNEKIIVTIEDNIDGTGARSSTTTQHLSFTGWNEVKRNESVEVSYKVTSLLSKDDDTIYTNQAEVESISLNKLTTLKNSFNWEQCLQETTLTIYSSTGADRSNIYWIAIAVGLITIVAGIVVIRKKILK